MLKSIAVIKNDISIGIERKNSNRSRMARTGRMNGSVVTKRSCAKAESSSEGNQLKIARISIRKRTMLSRREVTPDKT